MEAPQLGVQSAVPKHKLTIPPGQCWAAPQGVRALELHPNAEGTLHATVHKRPGGFVEIPLHDIQGLPRDVTPQQLQEALEAGLKPRLQARKDGTYRLEFAAALLGGMQQPGGDEKVRAEADTQTAATHYGFRVRPIDKDGNCLFKATADQLQNQLKISYTDNVPLYQVLRRLAANHIVSNVALYQHFTTHQSLADVEKLIQATDKEGEWAGDEALAALSRALQLTIVRVQASADKPGTASVRKPAYATNGTIYLHYASRSHYESLHKEGETAEVERMIKEAQADKEFIPEAIPNIQQLLHDTARAMEAEDASTTSQDALDDLAATAGGEQDAARRTAQAAQRSEEISSAVSRAERRLIEHEDDRKDGHLESLARFDRVDATLSLQNRTLANIRMHQLGQYDTGVQSKADVSEVVTCPRAPLSFFVGRGALIQKITQALRSTDNKRQIHLICGPGGVGKTELAIKLWNQVEKKNYAYVFWLRADSREQLVAAYLGGVAQALGLQVDQKEPQKAIARIRAQLSHKPCLLVFDDAPKGRVLRDFIPQQGHILITSRNGKQADWHMDTLLQPLAPFGQTQELVDLAAKFGVALDAQDQPTTDYLLQNLSGYPITLAQFFSVCHTQGLTAAQYVQELQEGTLSEQEKEILELLRQAPYEQVVYTSSMLQIQQRNLKGLEQADEGARALGLLSRFAYLDTAGIPLDWIVTLAAGTRSKVRKALELLDERSLVRWDRAQKQVYMHTVVQRLMRELHPQASLQGMIKSLIAYGENCYGEAYKYPAQWSALLQHGRKLYGHLRGTKPNEVLHDLTLGLCKACYVKCLYEEGQQWGRQSVALAEALAKEAASALVGLSHNWLGSVYHSQGKYGQAAKCHHKALAIREQALGKDHHDVGASWNNLGSV